MDAAQLEEDLYHLWKAACLKFGLGEPSRKHGVVVQDGSRASYVSKMGTSRGRWPMKWLSRTQEGPEIKPLVLAVD